MPKSTNALDSSLKKQIEHLAAFEPSEAPVLSLYLDTRSDQHGRDNYASFVRKAFSERLRAFQGEAHKSVEQDVERIQTYLSDTLAKSTNGLAVFACASRELFETVELEAPVEQHWLFVGPVPHLYPLIRLSDQYPRYAALLLDTNSARLYVFGLGTMETEQEVKNVKTRRSAVGGWSQARYQRHTGNVHLNHMKEVVDVLDRTVREEQLDRVVVACDEVARPALMEHLPQHLADKIVDVMRLDINTPGHQVLSETLEVLREKDADSDIARVEAMLNAWRAGGLAVATPEATLEALSRGQVEELLIAATPERLRRTTALPAEIQDRPVAVDTSAPHAGDVDSELLTLADQLVTHAHQTSARVRFIEDARLLSDVGGVGALLRFRI